MENRIPLIFIFLFSFFLLAVDSCETTSQEEELRAQELFDERIKTIETGLESNYLTEEAKFAFLEKSKLKLLDFGDYFSIYANNSLDSIFRNNAGRLLQELFMNDEDRLKIQLDDSVNIPIKTLSEHFEIITQSKFDAIQLKVNSIETIETLHRLNESTYIGTLRFSQTLVGMSAVDTTLIERSIKQCDIYVAQVIMDFGQETKTVWKVFLGTIEDK